MSARPSGTRRPMFAAALIERFDGHVLLVTASPPDVVPRLWHFPCGPVVDGEFAEAALRRIVREHLGLDVEIVVGQPPILCDVDGVETEWRYFFCGAPAGELQPCGYTATVWVAPADLASRDFGDAAKPVAEWLAGTASGKAAKEPNRWNIDGRHASKG